MRLRSRLLAEERAKPGFCTQSAGKVRRRRVLGEVENSRHRESCGIAQFKVQNSRIPVSGQWICVIEFSDEFVSKRRSRLS